MNKGANELLCKQKVKDEIYPVNPDGESLAKLEMIAEIKTIDPSRLSLSLTKSISDAVRPTNDIFSIDQNKTVL